MPLVLGVDSSTQATKVEVRDVDTGRLVATGSAPHPVTTPPKSEQDPGSWWSALVDAVGAAGVAEVDAISVAAQQHGLVALGEDGRVLRPAKLWNDTETAPDADWLLKQLDGPGAWAQAVGSVPVASFTITKLSWLHRSEPEAFERLAKVLLPHDWLTHRLTDAFVTDRGDASGTGYWSPAAADWRTDVLRIVDDGVSDEGWRDRLPDVLGPEDQAGVLTGAAAQALGLREGTLVGPGTGDNMSAALALGLRAGDVAVSLGTSGTVSTVSEAAVADAGGAVAGFADATGRFLPLVCTLNATRVTEEIASALGLSREAFADAALAAPPGADGVVVVPYFAGERTPNRPDATGTITGLRHGISHEHLARASHEGVVCNLLGALDALVDAGVATDGEHTYLLGGGARSRAYRHVFADLSQRPTTVVTGEMVAAGACVQAAAVLLQRPPEAVASAWGLGHGVVVEPDPNVDAAAIRAAYAAQAE